MILHLIWRSSNEDLAISEKYCFAGEIGLSGEIRPIPQIEQRISEAEKLGYEKIFVSNLNKIPKRNSTKNFFKDEI